MSFFSQNRYVSRRTFLRVFGAGLASATLSGSALGFVGKEGRGKEGVTAASIEMPEGRRTRRWSMAIDLRYCDGCRSVGTPPLCTLACIEGRFTPDPQEWIQVFEFELPGGGTQFVPTPCQHCQNAPCTTVCPVGAAFTTPEGVVLMDQTRCIGCRLCLAACPYDRRFFTWGEPPVPPETKNEKYSVETQRPYVKGVCYKCDFCPDVARGGRLPFCILGCPHGALYWGDLEEDVATNGTTVVGLARFLASNQAYRLKEHLGTKPRVYYLPGHGEKAGRDAYDRGRMATRWPWVEKVKGAKIWTR